mgnify:FL=1
MSVGNQITTKSCLKNFFASIAIMALFYATQNSIAAMPEISFACQVYHPKAGEEVTLVQANSRKEAIEIAHLKEGSKHRYFEVRQCVIIGEEAFKDSSFQRNFEKTPR